MIKYATHVLQGFSLSITGVLSRSTIALLGFSLFCCVPGLRTFGTERTIFLQVVGGGA